MAEINSHNTYDAAALICMDGDYRTANDAFFRHLGLDRVDEIKLAGGPKNIVDPIKPSRLETAMDDIATSIKLHGQTPNFPLYFMWHRNCGAYAYQDTEWLYQQHILRTAQLASHFSKPMNFIVYEIEKRGQDHKPKIVSYYKYDIKDRALAKSHLFTYQKD